MKKILTILILIAGFATVNLKSAENSVINIEGVENLGMGGPGTAFWSKYAVMYNPALIGLRPGLHIQLIDLPISISNDILKFYSFYNDNKDDLTDFMDISIDKQVDLINEITDTISKYKIRLRLGVLNPNFSLGPFPFLGRGGNLSWGVGFYNQLDVNVKMPVFTIIPKIALSVRADGVLAVPVVYNTKYVPLRLPGEIYAGVNIKYVMRSKYEKNMNILEFESMEFNADDLKPGSGFGWDWGLLYDYSDKWNFSLVLKDFLSTRIGYDDGSSDVIKGQVSLGSSYQLNQMILLAADLRDIKVSDIGKSTLFTKLYLGGEFSLISLLKLRGGFYQGYPAFGAGLLGILNYAYYGRELSGYPGLMPEWNHSLSLSFGF